MMNDRNERKKDRMDSSDDLGSLGVNFQSLAEKLGVGIYLIQVGLLKYVNPELARIFGYDVGEITNTLAAKALACSEDWHLIDTYIRKSLGDEGHSVYFQFRGLKKNGKTISVEAYGSRIEYEGRPAVIGTIADITDRTQGRRHLEAQLKIFQGLYNLALAMVEDRTLDENLSLIVDESRELLGTDTAWIALHDLETRELCWHISSGLISEEFKRLRVPLGIGLAGKVAQSGHYLIVEDYYKEIGPELHEVARTEGLISGIAVPVQIGDANYGVLFAFNRSKTSFSKPDLDTLSLFGNLAAVEITRKGALESLSESEQRYKELYGESKRQEELYHSFLNSTVDAIVIYDSEMKAQYVNASFTRTFGWTFEEMRNGSISFVPESELDDRQLLIETVLRKGMSVSGFETKRVARDGSTLDMSISASPYHDTDGNISGMAIILRDITSLKSLDRARRRAVHHLSHELVTPIAVIEASLKRLGKKDIRDSLKERNLDRIQRNLRRLMDIQDTVREIAIPLQYRPQAFQVDKRIEEILTHVRRNGSYRSVDLVTNLTHAYTDIIDPEILERVVGTLVKNAVENTPDEGKITISLTHTPEGLSLTIKDHGVGIDPKDRDFILKGFYHTQSTTLYATRKPFEFSAGGKGLELMRLKILAEEGLFDLSFDSSRCHYLSGEGKECCGKISSCPYISSPEDCRQSGGTVFTVLFRWKKRPKS